MELAPDLCDAWDFARVFVHAEHANVLHELSSLPAASRTLVMFAEGLGYLYLRRMPPQAVVIRHCSRPVTAQELLTLAQPRVVALFSAAVPAELASRALPVELHDHDARRQHAAGMAVDELRVPAPRDELHAAQPEGREDSMTVYRELSRALNSMALFVCPQCNSSRVYFAVDHQHASPKCECAGRSNQWMRAGPLRPVIPPIFQDLTVAEQLVMCRISVALVVVRLPGGQSRSLGSVACLEGPANVIARELPRTLPELPVVVVAYVRHRAGAGGSYGYLKIRKPM